MEVTEIDLKKQIILNIINYEWLKTPFPYSDFVNKAKYLLDDKEIKWLGKIIKSIELMFNSDLQELDILCSMGNPNHFIYLVERYTDNNGIERTYHKKMTIINVNKHIYKFLIDPVHTKLKKRCIEDLDL